MLWIILVADKRYASSYSFCGTLAGYGPGGCFFTMGDAHRFVVRPRWGQGRGLVFSQIQVIKMGAFQNVVFTPYCISALHIVT